VINGRHLRGKLERDHWEQVIEAERAEVEALLDDGVPRSGIYERLMQDAPARRAKPKPDGPDPKKRYTVPAGEGRPSLGPEDAPITVVVFSDFQCPFCARLRPTIHALAERHGDVRVVFRQLPLEMHPLARPAAKAALAAHRQGKFWELHDALFSGRRGVEADDLEATAQEVGLDMDRWNADRDDPAIEQMIAEDEALAHELGLRSTPGTFVNGRFVGGAQPAEAFDALIEEERAAASRPAEAEPVTAKPLAEQPGAGGG
jgi:protein-disulfide isomerase